MQRHSFWLVTHLCSSVDRVSVVQGLVLVAGKATCCMTGPVNITSADDSFNSGLFKNKKSG